jgi:hypothetical protein
MTKGSVDRQPNAIGSHPISPENKNQAAERRWLEERLEDDEVYEALAVNRRRMMTPTISIGSMSCRADRRLDPTPINSSVRQAWSHGLRSCDDRHRRTDDLLRDDQPFACN